VIPWVAARAFSTLIGNLRSVAVAVLLIFGGEEGRTLLVWAVKSSLEKRWRKAAGTLAWHDGTAKWLHTDQINIY
jgi:hypothetical protein